MSVPHDSWATPQDRHDKAVRVLTEVRELFSDRSKWIAGSLARNAYRNDVDPTKGEAVAFCAAGAIMYISHSSGFSTAREAKEVQNLSESILAKALGLSGGHSIPHTNDGPRGYEKIMAGLAKAVGASTKRRDAALKGWDTRRKRAFDREYQGWLREREAESVDPRPELMTFGGTITASPVTERKEVTV